MKKNKKTDGKGKPFKIKKKYHLPLVMVVALVLMSCSMYLVYSQYDIDIGKAMMISKGGFNQKEVVGTVDSMDILGTSSEGEAYSGEIFPLDITIINSFSKSITKTEVRVYVDGVETPTLTYNLGYLLPRHKAQVTAYVEMPYKQAGVLVPIEIEEYSVIRDADGTMLGYYTDKKSVTIESKGTTENPPKSMPTMMFTLDDISGLFGTKTNKAYTNEDGNTESLLKLPSSLEGYTSYLGNPLVLIIVAIIVIIAIAGMLRPKGMFSNVNPKDAHEVTLNNVMAIEAQKDALANQQLNIALQGGARADDALERGSSMGMIGIVIGVFIVAIVLIVVLPGMGII